jgi:hypothetical protein
VKYTPYWTVNDVKCYIQELEGIPIEHIRLVFAGKILEDERVL